MRGRNQAATRLWRPFLCGLAALSLLAILGGDVNDDAGDHEGRGEGGDRNPNRVIGEYLDL
jgi:hypothetical protein